MNSRRLARRTLLLAKNHLLSMQSKELWLKSVLEDWEMYDNCTVTLRETHIETVIKLEEEIALFRDMERDTVFMEKAQKLFSDFYENWNKKGV